MAVRANACPTSPDGSMTGADDGSTGGATHLECTKCGTTYDANRLWRLSPCCEKPLYPRSDLESIARTFTPDALSGRESTLWRYAEVLPVRDPRYRFSLGEGMTPLVESARLGSELGLDRVWIKDEGRNPTASFKARGLAMAVTMAKHFGITRIAMPTNGNAGAALAAYGSRAGIETIVPFLELTDEQWTRIKSMRWNAE